MIRTLVYLLSALTSATCAYLLCRSYIESRHRLLMWSSVCFAGLTAGNLLLIVELVIFPQLDLLALRLAVSDLALGALVAGLAWEAR